MPDVQMQCKNWSTRLFSPPSLYFCLYPYSDWKIHENGWRVKCDPITSHTNKEGDLQKRSAPYLWPANQCPLLAPFSSSHYETTPFLMVWPSPFPLLSRFSERREGLFLLRSLSSYYRGRRGSQRRIIRPHWTVSFLAHSVCAASRHFGAIHLSLS